MFYITTHYHSLCFVTVLTSEMSFITQRINEEICSLSVSRGQGHRSSSNCLLRRSVAPLVFVLLLTPLKCSKVCFPFSAVFHHLCRADDRQRRRQAAHWPAVLSPSRSVGMREKFQWSLLKVGASSFEIASAATVSALQKKPTVFSGAGAGVSLWQGGKESWSSSLSQISLWWTAL